MSATVLRPGDPGKLYECPGNDPSDFDAVLDTITQSLSSPLLLYTITERPDIQVVEVKNDKTYETRSKVSV